MTFLWRTALKDFHRQRRQPVEFVLWLGIPLVIGALVVASTGGRGGPRPQAHLLVVDQDDSALSNFLLGGLSQEAAGSFIRAEVVQLEAGRKRVERGEATALLVIPAGFSDAVLREEPCTLRLVTNPAQRILPGIVEETLAIFADAAFYLHRVLGEDLRALAGGPGPGLDTFPNAQIISTSVHINEMVGRVNKYVDPLVLELETTTDEEEEEKAAGPPKSFALYFLPGLLYMSLLFMAQGVSEDLWRERSQMTLRRLVVSPRSVTEFLGGKAIYGTALMGATGFVSLTIAFLYFHLAPSALPLATLWVMFSGAVLLLAMMTIQLHVRTQRAGNIVSMGLIFPLMMIGGSFFPFEAMPEWMAKIGRHTPNGWSVQQLENILNGTVRPAALGNAIALLTGVGSMLFLLCARRLRRGFAQG